jgi:predicted nuclease of restriction endonuclease-like (RecB) superfamily
MKYCLRFFQFYSAEASIGQQPVDPLPWGHNIQIFTKCASVAEARFYIEKTLEQGKRTRAHPLYVKKNI